MHGVRRTVKHLALGAQAVALGHEVVNLLAALQDALDGLVQDNLGLVELLLDLHDAVGLLRVLVLGEVVAQLGHGQLGLARGPRGARVLGEELVDALAEELVGDEGGVLVVRDDDAADALGAAVGVECVIFSRRRASLVSRHFRIPPSPAAGTGVPCSSTSCRWPGFVRSATVFANRVMNSP